MFHVVEPLLGYERTMSVANNYYGDYVRTEVYDISLPVCLSHVKGLHYQVKAIL